MSGDDIPALNAVLNGISTVLLATGYYFIKSGRREAHRNCMVTAFFTSAAFLVGYLYHKIVILKGVNTLLGAQGAILYVYRMMLATHVILAMVMVPMIFMTLARALRKDFEAHKRLARWTWPIWMYVSVTGVLIYFCLYVWWPRAGA